MYCVDWSVWFLEGSDELHPHQGELDANANQVILPRPQAKEKELEEEVQAENQVLDGKAEQVRLGSSALAALTDLCGRTVLSPAFFLGSKASSNPQTTQTLTISGPNADQHRPGVEGTTAVAAKSPKPRLYLRSHKMAGLKDLLLSEKLNTHAISLQLTAQSQVQLGGRTKRGDEAAKDPAKQDGRDANNPSRPKRTRKE